MSPKKARPDISLSIAFLTTRVKGPDIDDWHKLCHLVEYLRSMRELPLKLVADGTGVLSWYVDASFAVHPDMRGGAHWWRNDHGDGIFLGQVNQTQTQHT